MIYDTIPILPSAVGSTVVNASIYTVDCASLSGAYQTDLTDTVDSPSCGSPNNMGYVFNSTTGLAAQVNVPCQTIFSSIGLVMRTIYMAFFRLSSHLHFVSTWFRPRAQLQVIG